MEKTFNVLEFLRHDKGGRSPAKGREINETGGLLIYCPLTSFDGLILALPGAFEKVLDKYFLLD